MRILLIHLAIYKKFKLFAILSIITSNELEPLHFLAIHYESDGDIYCNYGTKYIKYTFTFLFKLKFAYKKEVK